MQANFDGLCETALWKDGRHLWHDRRCDHSAFLANRVHFLTNARHDREELRKVVRENSRNTRRLQILETAKLCTTRERIIQSLKFNHRTFRIKTLIEDLLNGVLGRFKLMFLPVFAIVRTEHNDLAFATAQ